MASGIGKLLAREQGPVGAIHSSPQCHGRETAARIAAQVRTRRMLDLPAPAMGSRANPLVQPREPASWPAPRDPLRPAASNTVVIADSPQVMSAFAPMLSAMADGELAMLRPTHGKPRDRIEHRLSVRDLSAYARAGRTAAQLRRPSRTGTGVAPRDR